MHQDLACNRRERYASVNAIVRFATSVFVEGDNCGICELLGHILFLPYAAEEVMEGVTSHWSCSLVDFCGNHVVSPGDFPELICLLFILG